MRRRDDAFLTREFLDLGGEREVLRALRARTDDGKLIRLGYGAYARAAILPITHQPMLAGDGFGAVSRAVLDKLDVPWEPTDAKRAYNKGRSTQVPMTPRVRLRGSRFSRKLGYKGMELLPDNLRAVADVFDLPGSAPVARDFQVVRAVQTLAALDAASFDLVFGGGTALARAHRIIRRISKDVDFKIVPKAVSRSALRRQLDRLGPKVSAARQAAGFACDKADAGARDEGQHAVWLLPYNAASGAGEGLRPTIKVELA